MKRDLFSDFQSRTVRGILSGVLLGVGLFQTVSAADRNSLGFEGPAGQEFLEASSGKSFNVEQKELLTAAEAERPDVGKTDSAKPAQTPVLGNPHPQTPSVDGPSLGPEKPVPPLPGGKTPVEIKESPDRPTKEKVSQADSGEKTPPEKISPAEQGGPVKQPPSVKAFVPPTLGPEWKTLTQEIQQTVQSAWQIPMSTQAHSPADLMQWALVWGCNAEAASGDGKRVNVLAILCHNYPCADRQLLVEHDGHFAARFGYGYQTHRGEFLALLAWARVPKEYPLQVGQQKRTVADLVQYEKLHCRTGLEQSHVLLGLSFYLEKSEETSWQNNLGQEWSLERLISEELRGPIAGAADGGMHRLLALSYAIQARRKHGLSWTPLCDQVQEYVREYQKHAFRCQNADGSWNPAFLEAVGPSQDRLGVLRSTGLIFRWLAFSLPEEGLYDARMFKSAKVLVGLLRTGYLQTRRTSPLEFSAAMYALDGLTLYEQRALSSLKEQATLQPRQ